MCDLSFGRLHNAVLLICHINIPTYIYYICIISTYIILNRRIYIPVTRLRKYGLKIVNGFSVFIVRDVGFVRVCITEKVENMVDSFQAEYYFVYIHMYVQYI